MPIAYGENADDAIRPDRPGARAATDHLVLRPLAAIGLTKIDVRLLARALGLSVAEKPAAPCLASRIPHGQAVTPEKLRQVEQAGDVPYERWDSAICGSAITARSPASSCRPMILSRAVTEPLRGQVAPGGTRRGLPVRGAGPRRHPVRRLHAVTADS